jgi:hypothetical protein
MGQDLQARHLLLVLNLAGRRYHDAPLIVDWSELAHDLGTKPDTVRHWAYELRDMGLLKIKAMMRRTDEGLRRARGVELDLAPFISHVQGAFRRRRDQRSSEPVDGPTPVPLNGRAEAQVNEDDLPF